MEHPAEQWHQAALELEPVEVMFRYIHLSLGEQRVRLAGTTLTVVRSPRGEPFVEEFQLLQIHDLRLARTMQNTRFAWPYSRGTETSWLYGIPEPICFTYHGRRHSFGVASREVEASLALQAVADYDQCLRARLGMDPEPNITTVDQARIAAVTNEWWDEAVPVRCMY